MASTVFGEVQLSLFVAGAAFGEFWNESRSAKCCMFQQKMLVVSAKSNLGCKAGNDGSSVFENIFEIMEHYFIWQAQYLVVLEGILCCPGRCKSHFKCEED